MKKLLVLLVLAALLVPLSLSIVGCGPGAEEIAKNSIKASEKIKTLHFQITSEQQLPRAPLKDGKVEKQNYTSSSSGDVDQQSGDLRVELELAPGVPVTAMQVEEKLYIQLGGNWYEMPESFQLPTPVTQSLSMSQYLKYFKTLAKEGDADVDGEACYHLRGEPDMKELVKLPGITDLLKDPGTGQQIRSVDELADAKAVFDFYIRKKDYYMKQSKASIDVRATEDLIKLGYAQAGDRVKLDQVTTLSKFNEKLNLQPPANTQPWPEG